MTTFASHPPTFGTSAHPVVDNLKWRVRVGRAAIEDRGVQRAVYDACMEDVLFWFESTAWCFEPRALTKIKPFVLWPHQVPAVLAMDEAITLSEASETPVDVVLDKSRGQGATWLYLLILLRRWLRDPMFSAGLVTRTEALVDSARDPDTLMWKVAWMLERLPGWMLPAGFDLKTHRSLSDHIIINPANGASIVGYSATGDVGRGGRKSVFVIDELGSGEFISGGMDYHVLDSTQHVTNCRFLVSTYGADVGAFYEAATDDSSAVKVILDWKDNPVQNVNSYIVREGVCVPVWPEQGPGVADYAKKNADTLKRLGRRGHLVEGKHRSPWYDSQCLRPGATPRSIAKELDRNPRGAVGKVFDLEVLDRMKEKCCRPPTWQGKPVFNNETLELTGLIRQDNGPLKLWFQPGVDNSAPAGKFAVGCDISAGALSDFSSNSVAEGVNRATGEQVLEYTVMGMMGTKFARVCIVLCRWLHNAYFGWEASGVAGAFGKEVLEVVGYQNVYFREADEVGNRAKSRKAGWWNGSDEDKAELFESMCIGMEDGEFIPRSEDLIRECGEYEWENGKIVHKPSKQHKTDGKAHGDRCVGGGVMWLCCKDRPIGGIDMRGEDYQDEPQYGTAAWRHRQSELANNRKTRPGATLRDLMKSY